MAYLEHTSVADAPTLIDYICNFAEDNGWTIERNSIVGTNRTATLRIVGVTDYIHLFNTSVDTIRHRVSVGYDSGEAPADQPGVSPFDGQCNVLTGPIPMVWMFQDGNYIHVPIHTSNPGEYRFISLGMISKVGAFDGGTFCESSYFDDMMESFVSVNSHVHFGSSWSSVTRGGAIRADCTLDSRTNFFHHFGNVDIDESSETGQRGARTPWPYPTTRTAALMGRLVKTADENTFSGRSIFHPIQVDIRRTGTPAYYSPAGTIPGIRYASLRKFDPEQEVTIGSDVWVVFPGVRKAPETGTFNNLGGVTPASGNFGYAFKKVT